MPATKKAPIRHSAATPRPGVFSRLGAAARFLAFGTFDFSTRGTNPGGGRIRRTPMIERRGEEALTLPWERHSGVALVRDLLRNAPQARGLSKTIRVNTVGSLGKLVFREDGPWYAEAAKWFNGTWGRHADFIDGTTWRETLQLCMSAIAFEGDFVVVFDDGVLSGDKATGKIALFEADQICNLDATGFAPYAARGLSQTSGIVVDTKGRKVGVIVCRERGLSEAPADKCFVLLCDPDAPDASPWRHVSRKFRLRQLRGAPEAFAAAPIIADNHEMLEFERIAAKQNSSRPATVLMESAGDDGAEAAMAMDGTATTATAGDAATDGAGDDAPGADFALPALERSGVGVDYVEGVRDIKYKDAATPNPNISAFVDYGMDMAGMALGVGHSQARFRTDSSYTAFRGDLAMTWATFADNQQFIEDAFSDWVAERAIRWAVEHGVLAAPPSETWPEAIAWIYPQKPSVDETKDVAAFRDGLACGMTTFQDRFGPNWRDHLAQVAAEQAEAKRLGLSLAQWKQDAAPPAATPAPDGAKTEDGEDIDGERIAEQIASGERDYDDLSEDELAALAWRDLHKRGDL